MAIFATAGAKVFIGGEKEPGGTDLTEASFSSVVWTEIKNLENIGTFGDSAERIDVALIDRQRLYRLKGVRDAGMMELVAAIDYADAGQIAVLAAEKVPNNFAFKVQFNDAPLGGTPSLRYFCGIVMSASEQLDGANSAMKMNASIAINSNIVRVNAENE